MGYNISRNSVVRNKPQLDELLRARKTIMFKSSNPRRLMVKLWEAIKSAEKFPEFHEYAEISKMYKFRKISTGVLCDYIEIPEVVTDGPSVKLTPEPGRPTFMEFPEAVSLIDVIGVAIKFDNLLELRFPSAVLNVEDSSKLYDWTQLEDTKWQFISHEEAGLTLTKNDVPEEILWRPDE